MGCRAQIFWFCVGLVHWPPPSATPPVRSVSTARQGSAAIEEDGGEQDPAAQGQPGFSVTEQALDLWILSWRLHRARSGAGPECAHGLGRGVDVPLSGHCLRVVGGGRG
jgi:hypothetical protein